MCPDIPRYAMTARRQSRRRALGAILMAVPALLLGVRAQAATSRRLTPAQTEGPFYPVAFPEDSDHDLLRNGVLDYPEGQSAWLEGVVTDPAGRPLARL